MHVIFVFICWRHLTFCFYKSEYFLFEVKWIWGGGGWGEEESGGGGGGWGEEESGGGGGGWGEEEKEGEKGGGGVVRSSRANTPLIRIWFQTGYRQLDIWVILLKNR